MPPFRTSIPFRTARWLALSCLLHVGLALSVPSVRASHVSQREADDVLRFEVQVEPDAAEEVTLDEGVVAAEPTPTVATPRPRRNAPAREPAPGPAREPALGPTPAEPTPTSAPAPQVVPNLSPFRIARAFVGVEVLGSADAGVAHGGLPHEHAGATNESVAASLRPGAPPTAPEPKLVKTTAGYQYRGVGFDVLIKRDGSLVMNDTYGAHVTIPLVPMQMPDGNWRILPQGISSIALLGANFDLYGYLDHLAGNDPYRSERRWFLEHTRPLREKLAQEAADERMRAQVREIWNAPASSFAERRMRTFAAWDELSDDELGARGRRIMEEAIRALCPASDARGFTPAELSALNARRKSKVAFAPYDHVERAPH